ncbi:prolyl-tRNA synthetase associated domain-containing protein [Dysosmobacter sp.]|uniref:prolyl-tRNA synthetase associated domain-containing protein n=1 Tax=Dysosmobacter sp. TaxID=2591382 RepID=UPI002A85CB79|nr:prolyl-tRNA synthetase associated domain-containing protein [Dysosmobacter sp.]MDY3281607.1 prolyl-tRNA synthetase associated domain-containing protein [Dysosmobacter sp.]
MAMNRNDVLALLEREGIPYELAEHPAVYTIGEMERLRLPFQARVAKNLFLRDDKKRNYWLLTLREDRRADLKALRRTLESRPLTFASEADLQALLGLEKGSVTPFGLLNDTDHRVRLLLDGVFRGGSIAVHPNENTATVCLGTADLERLLRRRGVPVEYLEL